MLVSWGGIVARAAMESERVVGQFYLYNRHGNYIGEPKSAKHHLSSEE